MSSTARRRPGRPRRSPRAVPASTRDLLLSAGEAAFAAEGLPRTRLEDVARAVGIRRPSLLYHFPTKLDLYAAVVRRAFDRLRVALSEALLLPARDFDQRLERLTRRFLAFLEEQPTFAPLLLREVIDGAGPGRELLLAEVEPLLRELEERVGAAGAEALRPDLPLRQALLQFACAALVRSASGPLQIPLFGPADELARLTRLWRKEPA